MKITSKIYADSLIKSVMENKSSQKTARKFFGLLLKNNHYQKLPKIIEALDQSWAEKNESILVKIYSAIKMNPEQTERIEKLLKSKIRDKFITIYITEPKIIAGLRIEYQNQIFDLSLLEKILSLKKYLGYAKEHNEQ